MRSVIIFDSEFGNTRSIAEAIAAELDAAGAVDVIKAGTAAADAPLPADLDLLVVGGPTQKHGLTAAVGRYLEAMPAMALVGVRAAAFDTRARGWPVLTGAASGGIARLLKKHGAEVVVPAESFLVVGTPGPLVDGEDDRAREWARHLLNVVRESSVVAAAS